MASWSADLASGLKRGSPTREGEYQNHEDELLIAATADVRRAWRTGTKASGEAIPASSDALLARH